LNNKIENLRVVNHSQNVRNQKKRKNCTSKYVGISHSKYSWKARITIDGKTLNLGSYDTEEEAVEAYKKKYDEIMSII